MIAPTGDAAARKFDVSRAGEYEQQSRIALAGYDACHELAACMLTAALGRGTTARILVAGAGGRAKEIISASALEPGWSFTAEAPSMPSLDPAPRGFSFMSQVNRNPVALNATLTVKSQESNFRLVFRHLAGTLVMNRG